MAALIDLAYMRSTFNFHKDVVDTRISPYIIAASRRLKKWVGAELYATDDNDLKEILKLTEATICMHFLELNLNTNIRPKGLVATETVEANVTVRYFNPKETAEFSGQFLDQAEELVREFLGGETPDLAIIESLDNCIDTGETWAEWQT